MHLVVFVFAMASFAWPLVASAQDLGGYASVMFDAFPQSDTNVVELRTRVFAERTVKVGDHVRFTAAGFADGLVADRGRPTVTTAAIVRPQEVHAELLWSHADLRIGFSRVVWGRLDEFLPTDVVNPLDLTRFFLEGRAEARMPVAMVRGRWLPTERFALDAVYIPLFRRGRFDQLDEPTAPFNVAPPVSRRSDEPAHTWSNAQGGMRASVTTGRVDWAVTTYRGFATTPVYEVDDFMLVERFPRFTMVGADAETVYGHWGLRGEVAAKDDSVEGGIGIDRKAGAYRVSTNLILAHRTADTHATVVASVDRSFARETRNLRTFAAYNASDGSGFARVILSFHIRDNVTLETSAGLFTGAGTDALSQLAARDFAYARLKVFF